MLVGLLLYAVRWMEGWLYRHLFKVGWLFSHNLQATTLFFYLFFLPGIALHEATMWLVAGAFNVRAERSIVWPATQTEARLKLDFVRLSKKANRVSLFAIHLSPLITGLVALWIILFGILQVNVIAAQYSGETQNVLELARQVTFAPDFWLWFYVAFTIAHTMFPSNLGELEGWRSILVGLGVFAGLLVVFGLGEVIIGRALQGPIRDGAMLLAGLFGCILIFDVIVTLVLRIIETVVEFLGGSSATYQNGRLVTMTRQQVMEQRAAQRLKAEKQAARVAKPTVAPKTIYDLPLPIPPAPGKAEAISVQRPPTPVLGGGSISGSSSISDAVPDAPAASTATTSEGDA